MKKVINKVFIFMSVLFLLSYSSVFAATSVSNSSLNNYNNTNNLFNSYYEEDEEDEEKDYLVENENSVKEKYYSNKDYVIESYDVEMNVTSDNVYHIKETIVADFRVKKHGIFRTIPKSNSVKRADGSTSHNNARITNINVKDYNYTVSRENGMTKIKIGSSSKYLTGKNTYVISYDYNIGNDKLENGDELYFNLVGTKWDTQIKKVTFKITMPKEFEYDSESLGFSTGKYGRKGTEDIQYSVDGNVISGTYNHYLDKYEGVNIRLNLPEGYFEQQKVEFGILDGIIFLIPIAGVILLYSLWNKYGRDEEVIDTVEFFPPDNLNSAELGAVYKGAANNKDVVSLLIYLANKGYLKIIEKEKKGILKLGGQDFSIVQLKPYDGNNQSEKKFLDGLFKRGKTNDEGLVQVEKKDLEERFYTTVGQVSNLAGKVNKNMYNATSKKATWLGIGALCLTYFATFFRVIRYSELDGEGFFLALLLPMLFLMIFGLILANGKSVVKGIFKEGIKGLLLAAIVGLPVFGVLAEMTEYLPAIYYYEALAGLVGIIIMLIILKYMPSRTHEGTILYGKVLGFKNFLETAEKEKIEALVQEEPTYFYDILPYAYVLGVTDAWIKKFESITVEPPTWYSGTDAFTIHSMNHFMNSTMNSIKDTMSSAPASSGSSGGFSSGGGGFSGGGSGGGGGGSW